MSQRGLRIGRRSFVAAASAGMASLAGCGEILGKLRSDTFTVEGSKIIDPDGEEFIEKGVNVNGKDWVWPKNTVEDVELIADVWNFNVVRSNNVITEDGREHLRQFEDSNDLDAMVEEFTSRGVVVEHDEHTLVGGYYDDDQLEVVKSWFEDLAERYQDNPYVWFNIANEPGGTDNDFDRWQAQAEELIEAIRDTGAENIIVVPGMSWGQDTGPSWDCTTVSDADSFILSRGPELAEKYDNIVFDFHVYDQWTQCQEKMTRFLNRAELLDLPVHVGEYGVDNGNNESRPAVETLFAEAVPRGVGRIVWHWYGGDGNELCEYGSPEPGGYAIDDHENPTNLTWLGETVWEDNHTPVEEQIENVDPLTPNPPRDLEVTATTRRSVTLAWEFPRGRMSDVDYYSVYVDGVRTVDTPENGVEVTDLEGDVEYEFFVTAIGEGPRESERSETIGATTEPGELGPGGFAARAPIQPTIDAQFDEVWEETQPLPIEELAYGEEYPDEEDLSGTARVLWDEEYLYVFAEVTDDVIVVDAGESYQADNVEIYLDLGNDKAGSYTDDDYQYRVLADGSELIEEKHGATEGVVYETAQTADGYVLEIAFPWDTLGGKPASRDPLGFDVQLTDNDGDGREHRLAWAADNNDAWQDTTLLGTVELVETYHPSMDGTADVPKTSTAPTIDGKIDDVWEEGVYLPVQNEILGTVSSEEELSGYARVLWDEEHLYVLADVTDDVIFTDVDSTWLGDNVEVYIDIGNDKSGPYTGDDYQFRFMADGEPGGVLSDGDAVEFEAAETDEGYVIEMAFVWDELRGEPATGAEVGFDIHFANNDGEGREGKLAWAGHDDEAWRDTSVFGTLTLVE